MKESLIRSSLSATKLERVKWEQRARRISISALLLMLTLVLAARANPQEVSRQETTINPVHGSPQVRRPPLSHLYMHFLLQQHRLDKLAAEKNSQGKIGSTWSNYFQERLGFTNADMAAIRTTGLRLESELREIGIAAVTIAKQDRAARAQSPSTAPFVPDPRLHDLTVERQATMDREMGALDQQLGPAATAKLNDFLQNHYLESAEFRSMLRPHRRVSPPDHPQSHPVTHQQEPSVQP